MQKVKEYNIGYMCMYSTLNSKAYLNANLKPLNSIFGCINFYLIELLTHTMCNFFLHKSDTKEIYKHAPYAPQRPECDN